MHSRTRLVVHIVWATYRRSPILLAETDAWLYFRNQGGLIYACRRFKEEFPDMSELFVVDGKPVVLPKGLVEIVKRAEIFSSDSLQDNHVKVELSAGKVRVRGEGVKGKHREYDESVAYKGKPVTFYNLAADKSYRQGYEMRRTQTFASADIGKLMYLLNRADDFITNLKFSQL